MIHQCVTCQLNSLENRMEKFGVVNSKKSELLKKISKYISETDREKVFSPEITRNILVAIQETSGIADPYKKEKEESNREMMNRDNEFRSQISNSKNPFNTALRLAVAGNIIDFGPTHQFDVSGTIERVLESDFAFDHSEQLKLEIEKANSILYLGDNCGEVVLDKLFLETINHPNVYFAVRELPVLNDVTKKEALEVGIDKVAKIISNGDDAPSTLLHRVSKEFLEVYNSVDLIISKGMGNYEGLMYETDPRLFFLLMIKCQVIGNKIGAEKGDFIVKKCVRN